MYGYIRKLKRENKKHEELILSQDEHLVRLDEVLQGVLQTERTLMRITVAATAFLTYTLLFGWNC